MRRGWRATAAAGLAASIVLGGRTLAAMVGNARADPVLRRPRIVSARLPAGAAPVRILLRSDIRLGEAATDRRRLERPAARTDALRPGLVLLPGDFIAGHDPRNASVALGPAALAATGDRRGPSR